jgi:hypothetical protein
MGREANSDAGQALQHGGWSRRASPGFNRDRFPLGN